MGAAAKDHKFRGAAGSNTTSQDEQSLGLAGPRSRDKGLYSLEVEGLSPGISLQLSLCNIETPVPTAATWASIGCWDNECLRRQSYSRRAGKAVVCENFNN